VLDQGVVDHPDCRRVLHRRKHLPGRAGERRTRARMS
jgi:hypothetical protein